MTVEDLPQHPPEPPVQPAKEDPHAVVLGPGPEPIDDEEDDE